MAQISASIKREAYKTEIHSPSGNVLISDEPESVGGKNLAFRLQNYSHHHLLPAQVQRFECMQTAKVGIWKKSD